MNFRAIIRRLALEAPSIGRLVHFCVRVRDGLVRLKADLSGPAGPELANAGPLQAEAVHLPPGIDTVRSREALAALYLSAKWVARRSLEHWLSMRNAGTTAFFLDGFSIPAGRPVAFQVQCPRPAPDQAAAEPNWRESLICPVTGMNNRQRAGVTLGLDWLKRSDRGASPRIYLYEQVTRVFQYVRRQLPDADVIGSEWLGAGIAGGTVIDGVRHEDCANLSLDSASTDLVFSFDVFEHVNEPRAALREVMRILKPGGRLIMTIPFHADRERSDRRAQIENGQVVHLLPAEYHGNPIDPKGSLVFWDYGWDFVQWMREAGLENIEIQVWWGLEYGHLGPGNLFFLASRP
jgi:Methyltransferase domain